MSWKIVVTREVQSWLDKQAASDPRTLRQVLAAIDELAARGPGLGRPLVDRIKGSSLHNLKELRPGSSGRSEIENPVRFRPMETGSLTSSRRQGG